MELRLGVGIGDFIFGRMFTEIIGHCGDPDNITQDEDDDNQLLYHYNDLRCRFTFYATEGDRLCYIRSSNPKIVFAGKKLIGAHIDDAKAILHAECPEEWEDEDCHFFSTHLYEPHWLIFNTEYDRVTGLELGLPFKNEEEYDWERVKKWQSKN